MKGNQKDIEIDNNITYSIKTETFNKSLRLTNHSGHVYVFKIKTNQRTVVSLQTTHDFIQPHSVKEIAIKLADKPSETTPLKLEFNYAIPTEQDIKNKDSKMTSISKENIYRSIITVEKNENFESTKLNSPKTQKINLGSPQKLKEAQKFVTSTPVKFEEKSEKVETNKESAGLSGKGEVINITNFIDVGTSKTFQIEQTTKINPFQNSQEVKVGIKPEAITFTKVESQQIQIPAKTEEYLIKSENQYPLLDSVFYSGTNKDFKPTVSYLPDSNKEKNDQEALISELQEKIHKECATIRNLRASATYGSVYPLPIILLLIVLSFGLGSLIESLLA